MRVLTVVADFGIGGTQRVAQNMTLGVQDAGVEVAVMAHRGRGPRERFYAERNIPIFHAAEPGGLAAAAAWQADIVHIHRPGYANTFETEILSALREGGARVVETNVFARYDRSDARRLIDVHCLLSRWCAFKWMRWRQRDDRSAFTILPNAVDTVRFKPVEPVRREAVRREIGVPVERFLYGRIGQPIDAKWSPAIFDAFQQACADGDDIGLLLVGAPAGYAERRDRLPPTVRDRIVMLETVSDDDRLRALFSAMDAFLHLARIGESFGMVLCEAMLSGVPVITLSTPLKDNSQLEIVGHEIGGLVALDLEGVIAAMRRIRRDVRLRRSIADRAPKIVARRFDIKTVAAKAIELYETLLENTSSVPIQQRLDALNGNVRIDADWINSIQALGLGTPPTVIARSIQNILHRPDVYAAYLTVKRLTSRLRG